MVNIIRHDLEFILKQIKIAEAHSGGTPLTQIRVDAQGNITNDPTAALAISTPLSPYGLRAVDGSYNNLIEGRDHWGASDNPFPRITDPYYRNEADDSIVFGAGSPGQVIFTDGNYAEMGSPSPQSMGLGGGTVVDADPRIISNLIVDQTLENPAAIYAALLNNGVTGEAITPALTEIRNAYAGVKAATPADKPVAQAALDVILAKHGVEMDGNSVVIPNVAPDEGLSAPYNGWFTLFGQFFDHGLDLVPKGGNGTIYIPLQPDDPLYNPASPHTNFMVLTRAPTNAVNLTTPWVDQNQTYTSHSSHQLFLREYALVDGKPVATGKLLEGDRGLATWADVKEQARTMLGVNLTDADVTNIPLFVMDEYGEFVRGPNGYPQLVVSLGADGKFGGGDDVFREGNPAAPISTADAIRTGHAFLDDIAHAAVPVLLGGVLQQDSDIGVGYTNADGTAGPINSRGSQTAYDNEALDAHYITGDGRGNENIGLSAVHHVFHSEHNHMVEQVKVRAIESGDLAFLNEWLLTDLPAGTVLPPATDAAAIEAFAKTLTWDGERLFQAARFTTEMQYQHLVFEEFARKAQPDVDAFVFNPSPDIDPAIFAEFAHVVYRFGHSMLRETVASTTADGADASMDLFDAFLNPLAFGSDTISHAQAAGAIVRGMTSQVGNEIDEFVTGVLRNQLVGIPLDLAALNIARGRDTGIPPLNEARRQFQEIANGDTQLDAYTSWTDFALNLKNPASIVNFIAAYGTHATILSAATVEAKRDAAMKLVFGDASLNEADRQAFLNGTGPYAQKLGGLEDVDLWVGGMAEKKMAFGGMLGSTFSFIFELQMENLQNADRFYYLSRVQGLNFLNELENNSFAKMVLNNTDLGETGYALPGDIFSVPDHVMYMDKNVQDKFGYVDPTHDDPYLDTVSKLVQRIDANGDGVAEYIRYNGLDHVLIQGTNGADRIVAGGGDDSVWGRDGNDTIEAGYGVDKIHGGKGDDIITNSGTDIGEVDMLHGEEGNDVIHGGSGLALVFGNEGQDYLIAGPDGKEVFGGTGNDFILGGEGDDFLLGNEGDDWMEAGNGFDTTAGDNSELNFNSTIIGHDVMFAGQNEHDFDAESGDDIMVQGASVMRNEGMFGYDWAIHKGNSEAADSDLLTPIFTTDEQDILRDRFDQVEALSGWNKNDVLRGDNRGDQNAETPPPGANGDAVETTFSDNELTQAGIERIAGLRELFGNWVSEKPTSGDLEKIVAFDDGNILLGGGGNDLIEGRGGNDVIDGDSWMNVRIRITVGDTTYTADGMNQKVYREADYVNGSPAANAQAEFGGKTLNALMLDRTLNPGQLSIVREIVQAPGANSNDVAVYWDVVDNYTFSRDADGSVLVSHTGFDQGNVPAGTNRVSDGVDRLWNVERLRFADGEFDISDLVNVPATGVPVINDLTPTEGQPLTVDTSGIQDPNGLGAFSYQWQMLVGGTTWTNIAGATAASFTPQDLPLTAFGAQANLQLRVVVSFEDARGNPESVTSASTGPVGVNWDGFLGQPFNGTAGDDIADGGDLSEVFTGGAGNDRIDGGGNFLGNDTVAYAGGAAEYDFGLNASGQLTVTDRDGGEGTDTLTAIEQLRFAGNTFTLVNGSNAGQTLTGGTFFSANRADILLGHGGNDTLNANGGNDVLVGGAGNDTVNGGDGNDLIVQVGATDGRDIVNGGNNVDTYQVNGSAEAETFTIYSRAAAQAAIPGLTLAVGTEIVIARNGAVVAELDNIEEIRVNTLQVTSPAGSGGGTSSGDTIQVVGNFNGTSLNFSTITVDGNSGNDTIDITSLQSAHRVVFRSNGGNDTIVGTLRAQDVIELAPGLEVGDYTKTVNANGTTTLSSASHTITYMSDGNPVIKECEEEETPEDPGENDKPYANTDRFTVKKGEVLKISVAELLANDVDLDGGSLSLVSLDEDEHGDAVLNSDGTITFTPKAGFTGKASFSYMVTDGQGGYAEGEVLITVSNGHAQPPAPPVSQDVTGGRGHDRLHGGDGDDRLRGGDGHDHLYGEGGMDRMWGGRGNDVYTVDDKHDRVHESRGQGNDTVKSSVSYSLSGTHVEKLVLTGSGDTDGTGNSLNNSLTGNSGANVLKGAAGHDSLKGMGGDDRLEGGSGNDKLDAGSGDDKLEGGSGRDRLYGSRGDDRLEGGADDDRLTGGSGEDIFVFQKGGGRDVVTDFRHGRDEIDVSGIEGVNKLSDLDVRQSGHDTIIEHGSDVLVLKGVNASDLDSNDFIF